MDEMKTFHLGSNEVLKHEAENVCNNREASTSPVRYISPEEMEILKAIDDVNHHRNLSKTYDNIEAVLNSLNS